MSKYNGAAFFDVDGTLVDERLGIVVPRDKVRDAINSLKKRGFLIGTATGRAKCYIPDTGIDFNCYVTCNGAVVELEGEEVYNNYIEPDKLCELVKYLEKEKTGYIVETPAECYYAKEYKEDVFRYIIDVFNMRRSSFKPYDQTRKIKANKIMISFGNMEHYKKISHDLAADYKVMLHHGNCSADIAKIGEVDKGKGILKIIKAAGIDINDTYAFGDGINDVEMIKTVGHGIAMTPCSKELDGVAEYITCGVDNDGVYMGLKHYGLAE